MVKFSIVYRCDNISNIFRKAGKADQETEGYYKKKIGWVKVVIMAKINNVKLKTLKQTRAFYLWELKRKESLTGSEREKYLLALKSIEKIIQEKEKSGEEKRVFCKKKIG